MKCNEVMEFMQRELDRDLSGPEQECLFSHLKQCPECSAMFERLKSVAVELEQLPKVFPPINIVDSILPKLAELEPGFAVPIAAVTAGAEDLEANLGSKQHNVSSLERRTPWFSWKLAGAAAAAAVVVGVFLFNGQTKNNDASESIAKSAAVTDESSSQKQSSHLKSSGAASGNAPNADSNDSVNSNVVPSPSTQAVITGQSETTKPEAARQPTPEPSQTQPAAVPKEEQTPTATPRPQLTTNAAAPAQTPPGDSSAPPVESNKMKATEEQSPGSADAAQAGAPSASPATTPARTLHGLAAEPDKKEPESSSPIADKAGPDIGIRGIAPDASPEAKRSVTFSAALSDMSQSPELSKTAQLSGSHVVISGSNGDTLFTSSNGWLPMDSISFAWRSDTVLAYTVTRQDGTTIVYIVDLEKKTEQTELQKK